MVNEKKGGRGEKKRKEEENSSLVVLSEWPDSIIYLLKGDRKTVWNSSSARDWRVCVRACMHGERPPSLISLTGRHFLRFCFQENWAKSRVSPEVVFCERGGGQNFRILTSLLRDTLGQNWFGIPGEHIPKRGRVIITARRRDRFEVDGLREETLPEEPPRPGSSPASDALRSRV